VAAEGGTGGHECKDGSPQVHHARRVLEAQASCCQWCPGWVTVNFGYKPRRLRCDAWVRRRDICTGSFRETRLPKPPPSASFHTLDECMFTDYIPDMGRTRTYTHARAHTGGRRWQPARRQTMPYARRQWIKPSRVQGPTLLDKASFATWQTLPTDTLRARAWPQECPHWQRCVLHQTSLHTCSDARCTLLYAANYTPTPHDLGLQYIYCFVWCQIVEVTSVATDGAPSEGNPLRGSTPVYRMPAPGCGGTTTQDSLSRRTRGPTGCLVYTFQSCAGKLPSSLSAICAM
jgi:hypothetical protein